MIDREPNEEDLAETDRAIAELEIEFTRVGVDMAEVAEAVRALFPDAFAQADKDASTAFGIDARSALAIIRTIKTGAGTNAFLLAMGFNPPPSTEPAT